MNVLKDNMSKIRSATRKYFSKSWDDTFKDDYKRERVKMMASSAHVVCNSHTHVASKFVTCFLSASVTHNSSSTYINIGPYGHIMTFELNAHIT